MEKERTLLIIKPEGVQKGIVGEIISRFEKASFKIIALKLVHPTKKISGEHYEYNKNWLESIGKNKKKHFEENMNGETLNETNLEIGEEVRNNLIDFLSESPVVVFVIEAFNAIKLARKMVGETSPENSQPGTIRGDYSHDSYELADILKRAMKNIIHASDSKENAKREIDIWFKEEEIFNWKKIDDDVFY